MEPLNHMGKVDTLLALPHWLRSNVVMIPHTVHTTELFDAYCPFVSVAYQPVPSTQLLFYFFMHTVGNEIFPQNYDYKTPKFIFCLHMPNANIYVSL